MFWRQDDVIKAGTVSSILEKPDVTLKEVLDDDYCMQEVKCGNRKLVEFLSQPENLVPLIKLCVTEPSEDSSEKKKYRLAHVASEIICADSPDLTTALANSDECFRVLSSFISNSSSESPPKSRLNPLLASFFSKTISLLVAKHLDRVQNYMQTEPSFLNNLISNLDVSAIMDSIFRIAVGNDKEEQTTNLKTWLVDQELVSKLLSLLDESQDEETHQNVSYLMCELIRCLRDVQYGKDEKTMDPLLNKLQSKTTLNDLLDRMFRQGLMNNSKESIISNGCAIFMTLLQTVYIPHSPLEAVNNLGKTERPSGHTAGCPAENWNRQANADMEIWTPDPDRIVEKCLLQRLTDFKTLLIYQGNAESMLLPMGTVDKPFGNARLSLAKLLTQLLVNGLPEIHREFAWIDLITDLLALFFKHRWNNLLHTCVVNAIACAFYSRLPRPASFDIKLGSEEDTKSDQNEKNAGSPGSHPSPLLKLLLESHHILRLLREKCMECVETFQGGTAVSPYSGHVMRMAIYAHYAMQEGPHRDLIQGIVEKLPEDERVGWNQFVQDQVLPYIKRNEPDQVRSFDDMVAEKVEDFGAKMAESLEQAALVFAEYNSRKTSEIPDEFGFASDAFTVDPDEPVYELMSKAADIDFELESIPEPPGEVTLEQIFEKRINLYSDSSDEDLDDDYIDHDDQKNRESTFIIGSGEPQ